ncbi:MAG: hypothetical protein ACRDN6_09625 [Gaiellaceae bacterium]
MAALLLVAPAHAERPGWWSDPSIASGSPEVGSTLLASDGSINCSPGCSAAGPDPSRAGVFFEWVSCAGTSPGGADRPTGGMEHNPRPAPGCVLRVGPSRDALSYVVRAEDSGRHVQLHVIATNYDCGEVNRSTGEQECNYSSGHGWSATLGPIGGGAQAAPSANAVPAPSGLAKEGQTLTASNGSWTGSPTGFSYQWTRCDASGQGCAPITGATSGTYTLGADDVGKRVQVVVTATNAKGSSSATSAATDVVASTAVAPAVTALPAISGNPEDMQTLTASPGTWTGSGPIGYAYQWMRCSTRLRGCANIEGATEAAYDVVRADIGSRIVVTVTASNRGGTQTATSRRTAHVTGAKPRPGHESLSASEIAAPNQLRLASVTLSARVLRPGGRVVVSIVVKDRRGFLVEGANVRVSGPRGVVLGAAGVTDADGAAAVTLRARSLPKSGKVVLTLVVSKPGDAAVGTSKRVALRVRGR